MSTDPRFQSDEFPRATRYHPDWVVAGVSGGAHPLWLCEWLTGAMALRPGMRVLDLGCGRGLSSVFLHREFGVQVWATDLWTSPTETLQRVRDAGVESGVFPIRADARSLPFAAGFFDAIVSIDSYFYFGTDDMYLNDICRFLKPDGQLGIAQAGLVRELDGPVPAVLTEWWAQDRPWCFHSADWWRRHWEKTGILTVERADTMSDGWKKWLDWQRVIAPNNTTELRAVEADGGRTLGYVRCVGRRNSGFELYDPIITVPSSYTRQPLLRPTG